MLTFDKNTSKLPVKIRNTGSGALFWSAKPSAAWLKSTPSLGKIDAPAQMQPNAPYSLFSMWPKAPSAWNFIYAVSVGIDAEGGVYVLDYEQKRVVKFDINDNFLFEIKYTFGSLTDIAFDSLSNAYILDGIDIRKFDKTGRFLANISDTRIGAPCDIAIDSKNNIYTTDYRGCVHKLDKNGKYLKKWGTPGFRNGQFAAPPLNYKGCALGIVIDRFDFIYVADNHYKRIQKFNSEGTLIKAWGTEGAIPSYAISDGQWGAFFAIDKANGYIYIGHEHSLCLHVFDTNGKAISSIPYPSPNDSNYYLGTGAVNKYGSVYFCPDPYEKGVYKLNPKSTWTVNGGITSLFAYPSSVIVDKKGNIAVVDESGYIKIFDTQGQLLRKAQFRSYSSSWSAYLAVDNSNNIYCVDSGTFKKFDPTGKELAYKYNSAFYDCAGIAADSKGFIYMLSDYERALYKLSQNGDVLEKKFLSSITNNSSLDWMAALCIDAQDNIYCANSIDGIFKIDQQYKVVQQWKWSASSGVGKNRQDMGICVDAAGNIYAAFSDSAQVHKYNAYGNLLCIWGERGWKEGNFMSPVSLAVGPDSCVYVADNVNSRVQAFSQAVKSLEISVDRTKIKFLLLLGPVAVTIPFYDDSNASKTPVNLKVLVY